MIRRGGGFRRPMKGSAMPNPLTTPTRVDRDEVFLEYTKSICPICKAVVDAEINVRDNRVYLRTAADRRRGRPRVGVVPRRGPVDLPVHHDVVIARLTLPRAHRVVVAGEELVAVERVGWEVVVALHHEGVVALGQHGPVPVARTIGSSELTVARETRR